MKKNFKAYATHYFNLGLNVTCITNQITEFNIIENNLTKSPSHKWSDLCYRRQSADEIQTYDWANAIGVGVALGHYDSTSGHHRDDICAIDIDCCTDITVIADILECFELEPDYEWVIKSGSNSGFHIIVKGLNYDNYIKGNEIKAYQNGTDYKYRFDRIEFRCTNHLVLPPSIHKSTFNYEFMFCDIPRDSPKKVDWDRCKKMFEKIVARGFELKEMGSHGFCGKVPMIRILESNENIIQINRYKEKFKTPFYLVFDIETTGLPKHSIFSTKDNLDEWPAIIQLAWTICTSDGIVLKKECHSFETANKGSFSVNIEFENLNQIAADKKDSFKRFVRDLNQTDFIVAHNIEFDLNVIKSEFYRLDMPLVIDLEKAICTMKSSANFCNLQSARGIKFPKLNELYLKLFDEDVKEMHNALSDALATTKCFLRLKEMCVI